ncbi:MAG: malectin domain-containing carbohydrate-binding protein [Polyangiaceae bacterium]
MPPGAPLDATTLACARAFISGLASGGPTSSATSVDAGSDRARRFRGRRDATDDVVERRDDDGANRRRFGRAGHRRRRRDVGRRHVGCGRHRHDVRAPAHDHEHQDPRPLWKPERYGGDATGATVAFRYSLAVTKGSYRVALHFSRAENAYHAAAGEQRVSRGPRGKRVLTDFDIFAESGERTSPS